MKANQHDAFWLWAGVKPQTVLDRAKTIYILGAEIKSSNRHGLEILRPSPPTAEQADIWLVIRLETLDLNERQHAVLLDLTSKWDSAGGGLVGVQIDFDANTRGLDGYAVFLSDFRKRLPVKYQLSITGLLDWSANGDPSQLRDLAGTIDEAVFQTYQGRKTISGYSQWLRNLDDLPMPFRIGLVQNGEWTEPAALQQNSNFKGYVIFLLNPER
ncbi:MAG: DUF3142 domain-containing protein [Parasphingorhabdus sp.]